MLYCPPTSSEPWVAKIPGWICRPYTVYTVYTVYPLNMRMHHLGTMLRCRLTNLTRCYSGLVRTLVRSTILHFLAARGRWGRRPSKDGSIDIRVSLCTSCPRRVIGLGNQFKIFQVDMSWFDDTLFNETTVVLYANDVVAGQRVVKATVIVESQSMCVGFSLVSDLTRKKLAWLMPWKRAGNPNKSNSFSLPVWIRSVRGLKQPLQPLEVTLRQTASQWGPSNCQYIQHLLQSRTDCWILDTRMSWNKGPTNSTRSGWM